MGVGICNGEGDPKIVTEVDGMRENEGVQDARQLATCHSSHCLAPITPGVGRKQGDFTMEAKSTLTVAVRKPICDGPDSSDHNAVSPVTPKHSVFDPFAPGPENMAQAPMCRKYLKQLRNDIDRRLHFGSSDRNSEQKESADDVESLSDQEISQTICENLLELIISKQTEGDLAETYGRECNADVCATPPEALFFVIADSCPAAPLKPDGIPTCIDLGLCRRKLAF